MATLGTRLFTWLNGELVGQDGEGNKYYRQKGGGFVHRDSLRRERRWVIYTQGRDEASRVPPEWHAWLHHWSSELPPKDGIARRPWMKPHQPNLTGTELAYRPPGHTLEGGKRDRATGDYEAWSPE
ncbi:NADH:ubiquinone oxidoreductase subunit [Tistlia consotensis]|uniref:NADH:ubiquinone oxidoreductase subunit n=1 Tax=Tistlia consotensis USBA 355 TaxID=560819 RepID=A0A1Y6B3I2_9PROT|nr:NADH:ubiquinone oxidoreductase subunit NDUFA12 [Tistlia consotensis]SME87729.1 NADH:ubiquinone oxidoreductase subunit [Tistlia consotensis USBA 355]SNR24075.1 NADH:ubiquinone oxidoreductase subunit [Tistlia consotensis]